MNMTLALLDVVALLEPIPTHKLVTGQVGTIVEELTDTVFEVEFSDAKGQTITTCAVDAHHLLKLTHELVLA